MLSVGGLMNCAPPALPVGAFTPLEGETEAAKAGPHSSVKKTETNVVRKTRVKREPRNTVSMMIFPLDMRAKRQIRQTNVVPLNSDPADAVFVLRFCKGL